MTSTFFRPILLALLFVTNAVISASAQGEIRGSSMEDLLAKIAVRDAKWAKQADLVKHAKSRATLVASLVLSLKKGPGVTLNEQFNGLPRPRTQYDTWRESLATLDRLKIEEAFSEIVTFSDVNAYVIQPWRVSGIPSEEETHPSYGAIRSLGKIGIPIFIRALAEQNRNDEFIRVAVQAINETANPRSFLFAMSGRPVLDQYAREYEQRSIRQRLLTAQYLVEVKEGETEEDMKVSVEVPTLFASDNEARMAQVLELHYTLTDQLAPSTEAQVLAAIAEAQKLKAFELSPDLCDKLAPSPPKTDANNVLAANPKGRQSAAIAKASEEALRSMSREALPALLDAVATIGRSPEYRQKAMPLILTAAGGDASARSALEGAAKVNDERAARLRAIIDRYSKPVAQ